MADGTGIEWTDATWNVVLGCDRVSPGCDSCFAIRTARRMAASPTATVAAAYAGLVERRDDRLDWTGQINTVGTRLNWPLTKARPRRIFVNAQSDLFHDAVPHAFLVEVFAVMATAEQHTFQILTKRHARMRSLLSRDDFRASVWDHWRALTHGARDTWTWPLRNVHLGVSVEDQERAELRIPALLETPAVVRWLSCEPLLGRVDLRRLRTRDRALVDCLAGDVVSSDGREVQAACPSTIDWVVVGGESGPTARPMHPAWPRHLRNQCVSARVPFSFKQWGEYGLHPRRRRGGGPWPHDPSVTVADDGTVYQPGDLTDDPPGPRHGDAVRADHHHARLTAMYRVGKKEAGRELDGQVWDEQPKAGTA